MKNGTSLHAIGDVLVNDHLNADRIKIFNAPLSRQP